jgi:hypothetical protein
MRDGFSMKRLTPISVEELPPNKFFFDKKRKVVVKQELYQKEGAVAKRFKILTEGKAVEEEEFTDEIAGTLGAYATANQYSVGTLKAQLKWKNLLIGKLEAKVATTEANARDEMRKSLEQARIADLQEIEKLRSDLEQVRQSVTNKPNAGKPAGATNYTVTIEIGCCRKPGFRHKGFSSPSYRNPTEGISGSTRLACKSGNHSKSLSDNRSNARRYLFARKRSWGGSGCFPGCCDSHNKRRGWSVAPNYPSQNKPEGISY